METIENILKYINGSGYGSGDGSGDGSGSGYGSYIKLNKYKKYDIFYIDNVPTIFDKIKGNVAKVKIINIVDFTAKKCYLIKSNGLFAHGNTLRLAQEALQEKIFSSLNLEERIIEFNKLFDRTKKYKGKEFFDWHSRLTGSCLTGREWFVKNKSLNLNDMFTVDEFIAICENDYGGEIIKKLKENK